jgi:uncharacterized protein YigA (DUF484 family)
MLVPRNSDNHEEALLRKTTAVIQKNENYFTQIHRMTSDHLASSSPKPEVRVRIPDSSSQQPD